MSQTADTEDCQERVSLKKWLEDLKYRNINWLRTKTEIQVQCTMLVEKSYNDNSLHAQLFTLKAHRACKFKYLQAHHQFYRHELHYWPLIQTTKTQSIKWGKGAKTSIFFVTNEQLNYKLHVQCHLR
jgi:hypothetical protein